jgi:hypothetical protein
VPELIEMEHVTGADALANAYARALEGEVEPREGLIFTL